jgi:sialidase-1
LGNSVGVRVFESGDEGATWSDPKTLGKDWHITLPKDISLNAPGVAHGIQIDGSLCPGGCKEAGRLLVPFTCTNTSIHTNSSDKGCLNCVSCNIFSDDAGQSWVFGGVGNPATREHQITQVASTTDSARLYLNLRNMGPTPGHRMVATSVDGGESYGGYAIDPTLTSPVTPHWTGAVEAVTRLTDAAPAGSVAPPASNGAFKDLSKDLSKDRLLFTGVLSTDERKRIGTRVSLDSGKTWAGPKVVWEGPAAYSDVARVGADGGAVMIFENGDTAFAQRISIQRLPLSWMVG